MDYLIGAIIGFLIGGIGMLMWLLPYVEKYRLEVKSHDLTRKYYVERLKRKHLNL